MTPRLMIAAFAACFALPAAAYIGPGSGISLLGGIWGVLLAIVLAVGAILIWPVRLMLKRMRARRTADAEKSSETQPARQDTPDPEQ